MAPRTANRGGSGNLHSEDEWIAGLRAAMLAASRRQDEQATAPEPQPGVQGEGGLGCREGEKTLAELAQQLGISRGSLYYLPRFMLDADLSIMRRIDELHLLDPFAGSRILRDLLRHEGSAVVWPHVATLVKRMGMEALYRRPNTSKPAPGHKVYPYQLRKLAAARPTGYTSTSRFSQRHDQPAAIDLSKPRACADKPSQLCLEED